MNMVYMPAGRKVWREVARKFHEKSITPKIWLGDPVHDEYARVNYSDCLVLDFYTMNKVIIAGRYNIKLKKEVLEDKFFYTLKDQVYKMMDRQDDFGVYGRLEREAFFYSLFFYFYAIVIEKNIRLLVASEGPHSPASMILYGVCRILGIKTYHLDQNSITPVAHISRDFYGGKVKLAKERNYDLSEHESNIRSYIKSITDVIPIPYYMKTQKEFDRKSDGVLFKVNKFVFKPIKRQFFKKSRVDGYAIYSKDFFKSNRRPFFYEYRVANRKNNLLYMYKSSVTEVDLDSKFVYLPLHYEPEKTSNPDGGGFYNAYDMIMWLRSFVPKDVSIVIKEHYSQFTNKLYGYRGRSPLFYKAISTLDNVYFVSLSTPSNELISKSIFIATQTGTSALEAALMQKHSLVFGSPWFLGAPNVYKYNHFDCFERLCNKATAEKESVEKYLISFVNDYTIPACINPSGESGFKNKYGEMFYKLVDDEGFAERLTSVVYNDYMSIGNAK